MEIISHAFWAATAYKAKQKIKPSNHEKKVNFFLFVFWSMFPDIISFGLIAFWIILVFVSSGFDSSFLPSHMRAINGGEPSAPAGFMPIFQMTSIIYSASHSIVIFFLAFSLFFYFLKNPPWTMLGWFLHILIDIPTHSSQFYPTPFLWPLSNWHFYGISWGTPWFLILNYSAMIIVYFLFWRRKRKKETIV
jgi:hypothetical protein